MFVTHDSNSPGRIVRSLDKLSRALKKPETPEDINLRCFFILDY